MNFYTERILYSHKIAKRGSAGNKWEGIRESWQSPVLPYENNDVKVFSMPKLNPINPGTCPHCGMNHGRILREAKDIFCINCGWRDAEYYNIQLNKFIKWVNDLEDKYGKPELLSDAEALLKQKDSDYYQANKSRIDKRIIAYQANHKEQLKQYHIDWYKKNRARLLAQGKLWSKEHPRDRREYCSRRYYIKKLIKILKERCEVC